MMITIGSDHRGFNLKTKIIEQFSNFCHSELACGPKPRRRLNSESSHTIEWLDVGTNSQERTDYPIFAKKHLQNQK